MEENRCNIINTKSFVGFLLLEFFMLIALKLVQTIYPSSIADTFLMFGSTMINAIFMVFWIMKVKRSGKALAFMGIPLATFVMFFADIFLVLAKDLARKGVINLISSHTARNIGFFIFGTIQVIYAFHIGITKRRMVIRVVFYLLFVAMVYAANLMTLDLFIACLSMSQLILNLVFSWIDHKKKQTRASLLFALGITIFFLGDAFISVRMMLPSDTVAYAIIRFMVWVFYIPSQVLLTSSYLADRTDA